LALLAVALVIGCTIGASAYAMSQVRKPTRWVGRLIARAMNRSHAAMTDWALGHVRIASDATILDVGCGGGATVGKLAALAPEGKVHGVDHSRGCVAESTATNAAFIGSGQVEIRLASVSHLPFKDDEIDLATAFETQYYWPDPVNDLKEILRVLKPGGTLLVAAEAYSRRDSSGLQASVMKLLGSRVPSVEDERQLFGFAGFDRVQVTTEPSKGWMCAMGRKREALLSHSVKQE
jgi:ubiquinone/menaquinone biosynthesis C-methylase UbiE